MILLLGAAAGCANETDTAAPAPSQSPPVKAPPPSYTSQPDTAKPTGTGEMKAPPGAPASKSAEGTKGDEAPKIEGPKADNDKPDTSAVKLTADEQAAIKELPDAEQATAIAQGVCPVSTENLGSMGKPLKVTAEGRTFYLCCKNCQKELKANPKAVIAKLDKKGK
jgi:hypothetical protein